MRLFRHVKKSLHNIIAGVCDNKKQGKHLSVIEKVIERLYRVRESDSEAFYNMPPPVKKNSMKNYLRAKKIYEHLPAECTVDAVIILQHLIEIEPDYKEPYMLLGQCYMRLEDYPTATHYFQMAKNTLLWMDQKKDTKELDKDLSNLLQEAVAKRAENFL